MSPQPPSPPTYAMLRDSIAEIFSETETEGKLDSGRRKARRYWRVGDNVHRHLLGSEARAGYGERIMSDLKSDLSQDLSLLYTMVRFRRAFPTGACPGIRFDGEGASLSSIARRTNDLN